MATAVREIKSEPRHDQIVDLAADRHIKVNEHLYLESPDGRCGHHLDGEIGVSNELSCRGISFDNRLANGSENQCIGSNVTHIRGQDPTSTT